MKPIISVEGLSKVYRIGSRSSGRYRTLRESLTDAARTAWLRVKRRSRSRGDGPGDGRRPTADPASPDEFWALEDVSFEVWPGEVVGIVGRNGAGKSTLLKILSRITEPSRGCVEMRGRVASLLEVGTGFHPELTGRENIYLNGAILGMSRREIARKFDEIAAFAEVEKFLDMPVKRYSSGMYVRLAFAVASHLEPEILVIDEVLAVGDMTFQKKCLGKMDQVRRDGRTVLFVSHNMTAVKSLCSRALLLEGGRIAHDGTVDEVVNRYLTAGAKGPRSGVIPENAERHSDVNDEARLRSVRLTDAEGRPVSRLYFGQPFRVEFTCDLLKDIDDGHFEVGISTLDGTQVTYTTTLDGGHGPRFLAKGRHEVRADFDVVLLPREYTIDLGVHHHGGTTADFVQRTYDFTVLGIAENGSDHYRWNRVRGLVRAPARWHFEAPGRDGRGEAIGPVAEMDHALNGLTLAN
jgi:lipopolysaccharide transport system ATP-binding protein